VSEGLNLTLGFVIGTPMGYAFPLPWTSWGTSANDAINDFIAPPPGMPSVPARLGPGVHRIALRQGPLGLWWGELR
jgi:hypothetical protein